MCIYKFRINRESTAIAGVALLATRAIDTKHSLGLRLSDFLFPQHIELPGLCLVSPIPHGYRDTTLVPDITLVPVRSYHGRRSLINFIFVFNYTTNDDKKCGVNISYGSRHMSFIFSNSKPFHCLFIVFSQILPKLNYFIVSCSKTRKDIDLKSSGNPPDEIFTALTVFGIVKNEYK